MDISESLTRGTVWLALSLFVGGELTKTRRGFGTVRDAARWLDSAGCATFLAHVVCAFHFYHHWSHAAAHADTARQTAALFGWKWGGGIYLNYIFALVWLGEVVWSWANLRSYLHRPSWMNWTVRGLFLFMIFNGAVVFARTPMRWFGLILCLTLAGCWWASRKPVVGRGRSLEKNLQNHELLEDEAQFTKEK